MPSYYPNTIARTFEVKAGEHLTVKDFGVEASAGVDQGPALNAAIADVVAQGGAELRIPRGTYGIATPIVFGAGVNGVKLVGEEQGAVVFKRIAVTTGSGVIDIQGATNVQIENITIDGDVTTAVPVRYADIPSGNPMATMLTNSTSIWIKGGSRGIILNKIRVTHTGGYAVLVDATAANVDSVLITASEFVNNRPHLFGTANGACVYGGWTGGIHYQSDGSLYRVADLNISKCRFDRVDGNCVWGHLYAFGRLHTNINVTDCSFTDIALDGILSGGVFGGVVRNNIFRRVGYVHTTDNDTPIPAYLPNAYAVGIDTSGLTIGVNYTDNSLISVNGGCMDLDGFSNGVVSGNTMLIPEAGTPEYTEDNIVSYGYGSGATAQSLTYGIQPSNSQRNAGGSNITITGNTIINCQNGAIRLYMCRNCYVAGNNIIHPFPAISPPVMLGPKDMDLDGTVQDVEKCTGNVITNNSIQYAPSSQVPAIYEDSNYGTFASTDRNWVMGNFIYEQAFEFQKNTTSGSVTNFNFTTVSPSTTNARTSMQVEGTSTAAALKLYRTDGTLLTSFIHTGVSNFSLNGTGGVVATGPRTTTTFSDAVYTGKTVADAFAAIGKKEFAIYSDADANAFTDDWALLRYNKTAGQLEQSVSVSGTARVWSVIGGTGGSLSGLTAGRVPFAATPTSLTDSSYLTWDNSNQYFIVGAGARAIIGAGTNVGAFALQVTGNAFVWSANSSALAFVVKGATSQTGNLTEWQDISGVGLTAIDANGLLAIRNNPSTPSTGVGYYGASRIQFKTTGADTTGGFISHRDYEAGNLVIAGAGASPSRLVKIYDQLVVNGSTGGQGILLLNGYIEAAGGFYSTLANPDTVNIPNGGVWANSLISKTAAYLFNTPSAAPADPAANYGGLAYKTASTYRYWNGAAWSDINFSSVLSGNEITGSLTAGRVPFASAIHALTDNSVLVWNDIDKRLGVNKASPLSTLHVGGSLTVDGTASTESLSLTAGYIKADGGFLSNGIADTQVNIPAGGVWANKIISKTAAYLIDTNSAAPTNPGSGYGGIAWKTGAVYRFWNGSAWIDVNVSSVGGVSSIIGTANQVIASSPTGAVTLSLPQSIATNSSVTFNSITAGATGASNTFQNSNLNFQVNGNGVVSALGVISSTGASGGVNVTAQTATNSIQTVGGFNAGSSGGGNGVYQIAGVTVINSSRSFVGASVATGAITCSGLSASGTISSTTSVTASSSFDTSGSGVYRQNGSNVIDTTRTFVGSGGINTSGSATIGGNINGNGGSITAGTSSVSGRYYCFNAGSLYTGQDWTVGLLYSGGSVFYRISGVSYNNLVYKGGLLVGVA